IQHGVHGLVRHLCGGVDFFFFSSRRRHTRFSRDWSSDVCSSDLISYTLLNSFRDISLIHSHSATASSFPSSSSLNQYLASSLNRSEERRVGKECRSVWGSRHETTNMR